MSTNQLSKKPDYKIINSFEALKKKSIFFELHLTQVLKIYNIFHLNFFKKASINLLIRQINKQTLLGIIINKKKWKIKDILSVKII